MLGKTCIRKSKYVTSIYLFITRTAQVVMLPVSVINIDYYHAIHTMENYRGMPFVMRQLCSQRIYIFISCFPVVVTCM